MQLGSAWTVDSRRPVATPQTNNPTEADPNNMTQHPANAGHRTFLSHVRPLQYPPDLEVDIKDHPDCDLPIKHIPLPDPSWYQLFGQGNADTGDLWAWWGQQVSEVRAQISPVPAG